MPKTNYRECWWLIQAVTQEWGNGSYKNGRGYSLKDLNNLNMEINHEWAPLDPVNSYEQKKKDSFRRNLINRRATIYNEFGLAILQESTPGVIAGKGWGGYYYYLANPELLDKGGKSLRDIISFLADSETKREEKWVKVEDMADDYYKKQALSMGFISSGGPSSFGYLSKESTSYRAVLGEENLEIIQFAMQFGEVLTIKYGKMRNGVDINAPYSFEPYELKEIEGRWYVIGNLYPLGHKEAAEIAIYDLARLQFADEENPDVLYEPFEGFNICGIMAIDPMFYRCMNKVIPVDLITHTEEFADYLAQYPFCSAQERLNDKTFRTYRCVTREFIVQLGAYGEELTIGLPRKDGDEKDDRILYHQLLKLLKKTDE
jgi:hypothetical protein